MSVTAWFQRCTPGLSFVILLLILESALGIFRNELAGKLPPSYSFLRGECTVLQAIFICYSLLLHLLAFAFPIRLCVAAWSAASRIKQAHQLPPSHLHLKNTYSSSDGSLTPDDFEEYDPGTPVTMAIILPSYQEDISVLEDTLNVLASHKLSQTCYDVVLAMEERDANARLTAEQLLSTFKVKFYSIRYTVHPANIEGEASGKSSNVRWAAKEIEKVYAGCPHWKDVLVTVMDSDTHLLSHYFEHILSAHMQHRLTDNIIDMTLYMPPIIFDRNCHTVPRFVRVADMMWAGAGLSCFQSHPTRTSIAIPTAVYTMSLPLIHLVGGWDGGPEAIGEDMHMMLKCYFATGGRMTIESVPSPASQCNVTSGRRGIRGYLADLNARYNQGLRHMWGCLDTGFALHRWYLLGQPPRPETPPIYDEHGRLRRIVSPRSRKLSHTELQLKLSQHALYGSQVGRMTWRNGILFMRMFEAHFLPAHLFLVLIASAAYTGLKPSSNNHSTMLLFLDFTAWLRCISYVLMVFYFAVVYERYHRICLQVREQEMMRAGLHKELFDSFSRRQSTNVLLCIDWFVFPIAGMIYGCLPLFQAAISHFWTEKLVYLVSAKPIRTAIGSMTKHVASDTAEESATGIV